MRITYISHSSFALRSGDRVLLFDYPSRGSLLPGAEKAARDAVRGSDLYVFISHSHGDHYGRDVLNISKEAERAEFIVSEDVPLENSHRLAGGRRLNVDQLDIETFASNDAGVAYLIRVGDRLIYYGGDLAKWDWDEFDQGTRRYMVDVFGKMIRHLSELDVDVAFSNTDQRLQSWAGALEFLDVVKPSYFVPMHTFGHHEWIDDLVERTDHPRDRIFRYDRPGDFVELGM